MTFRQCAESYIAAHQAGWRVLEDLSVVGIDDIQFASYTNPGLTTVAQPKQELGALAVDAALARAGKQTPARGSDGPASGGGVERRSRPDRLADPARRKFWFRFCRNRMVPRPGKRAVQRPHRGTRFACRALG